MRTIFAIATLSASSGATAVGTSVTSVPRTTRIIAAGDDTDGDGYGDDVHNCPGAFNPSQVDNDSDNKDDVCDSDDDNDGLPDGIDNYPLTLNQDQSDCDDDGQENTCDDDGDPDVSDCAD
jgi:hypothetical protein